MNEWRQWPIAKITPEYFPEQLRRIKNSPKLLYCRGKWRPEIFDQAVAIVGSRRMTRYGRGVVESFMPEMVAKKITVISGFMYGVDSLAHGECLKLGGTTVAVLGCGLNYLATIDNDGLYTEILKSGGLVVSEFEPEYKATLWSFPQRNRIVAGLSNVGVVVVEAGMKSGSLITARLGREQSKAVWALPGPIDSPTSAGCNFLLKNQLAKMATGVEDILGEGKGEPVQKELFDDLSPEERKIVDMLSREPAAADEIAKKLNLPINTINIRVSLLAMKNLLEEENGMIYLRKA